MPPSRARSLAVSSYGCARATIRTAPRPSLVVEMHPQCWSAFAVTEEDARDALGELGLTARPLIPGEALFGRDTHAVLSQASAPVRTEARGSTQRQGLRA